MRLCEAGNNSKGLGSRIGVVLSCSFVAFLVFRCTSVMYEQLPKRSQGRKLKESIRCSCSMAGDSYSLHTLESRSWLASRLGKSTGHQQVTIAVAEKFSLHMLFQLLQFCSCLPRGVNAATVRTVLKPLLFGWNTLLCDLFIRGSFRTTVRRSGLGSFLDDKTSTPCITASVTSQ